MLEKQCFTLWFVGHNAPKFGCFWSVFELKDVKLLMQYRPFDLYPVIK